MYPVLLITIQFKLLHLLLITYILLRNPFLSWILRISISHSFMNLYLEEFPLISLMKLVFLHILIRCFFTKWSLKFCFSDEIWYILASSNNQIIMIFYKGRAFILESTPPYSLWLNLFSSIGRGFSCIVSNPRRFQQKN